MQLICWAVGTNGEGSSKVVVNLIKALLGNSGNINYNIYISSNTTLEEELSRIDLLDNPRIVKLPKIFRNYLVQYSIKFFLPINFFCDSLITLDDYPFRNSKNQILYFHQPNIIFSKTIIWKIKRLVLRTLLTDKLKIFLQTNHFKKALMAKFENLNSHNIFHALHFDK